MRSRKSNRFLHIALLLLCAVLITAHMTSGLYAKYRSGFSSFDGARVARFDVTSGFVGSVSEKVDLNFYDPKALSDWVHIAVTSQSEVTVSYDVIVTMPALASGYEWLSVTLDSKNPTSVDSATGVYTFSNVATIAFSDHAEKQNAILFAIKNDFHGNPPSGLADISGQILITVRAEQLD